MATQICIFIKHKQWFPFAMRATPVHLSFSSISLSSSVNQRHEMTEFGVLWMTSTHGALILLFCLAFWSVHASYCSFWIKVVPRAFLRRGEGGREKALASAHHVTFNIQKNWVKQISFSLFNRCWCCCCDALTADRFLISLLNSSPLIFKNAILSHPTFLGVWK